MGCRNLPASEKKKTIKTTKHEKQLKYAIKIHFCFGYRDCIKQLSPTWLDYLLRKKPASALFLDLMAVNSRNIKAAAFCRLLFNMFFKIVLFATQLMS